MRSYRVHTACACIWLTFVVWAIRSSRHTVHVLFHGLNFEKCTIENVIVTYTADKQDVHVAFHGSTDLHTRENLYQVYSVAPSTDPANATAFEASLLFSLFITKHQNHTFLFGNVRAVTNICGHISNYLRGVCVWFQRSSVATRTYSYCCCIAERGQRVPYHTGSAHRSISVQVLPLNKITKTHGEPKAEGRMHECIITRAWRIHKSIKTKHSMYEYVPYTGDRAYGLYDL